MGASSPPRLLVLAAAAVLLLTRILTRGRPGAERPGRGRRALSFDPKTVAKKDEPGGDDGPGAVAPGAGAGEPWTAEEHEQFLRGLAAFGPPSGFAWMRIAQLHVRTRSSGEVREHWEERAAGAGDPGRPPGRLGGAPATVLQAADPSHLETADEYLEVNRRWAACAGYAHRTAALEPDGCVYTAKVRAIRDAVANSDEGAWVVYLDVDAVYQRGRGACGVLGEVLPATSDVGGAPCEFVASGVGGGINTGVLAVRNTPNTRRLLDRWLAWQQDNEYRLCSGPADQIALQEAVLEEFADASYPRPGFCLGKGPFKRATPCFQDFLPAERLSQKHLCISDCHTFPLQMRSWCLKGGGAEYDMNAPVFFHDKQKLRWKIKALKGQFP